MATPVQGADFLIKAAGTIVEGMNKYNKQRTRATTSFPVFNRATPYVITAAKEEKYSVTGLYMPGDPGQAALLAAEIAQTNIVVTVLPDGAAGFSQPVLVNSFTHDATPDGFQEITFEFSGAADATAVAGGDLL